MIRRLWRSVAWLFGHVNRWAQGVHDDLHPDDVPGCKGCEYRTAEKGWKPGDPPVIECECGLDDLLRIQEPPK